MWHELVIILLSTKGYQFNHILHHIQCISNKLAQLPITTLFNRPKLIGIIDYILSC